MTDIQVLYYHRMLERKRLFKITLDNDMKGVITFYIVSFPPYYLRDDPWEVLDDEPETGSICFVDHLIIPESQKENSKYSFQVWKMFKDFIKENYPQVRLIQWQRLNKEGVSNAHYYFFTK